MTTYTPPSYSNVTVSHTISACLAATPLERAQSAARARNHAEAAQWFKKALEGTPENPQAMVGLGQSLCSLGRRVEGTAYLRQAGEHFLRIARQSADITPLLYITSQL